MSLKQHLLAIKLLKKLGVANLRLEPERITHPGTHGFQGTSPRRLRGGLRAEATDSFGAGPRQNIRYHSSKVIS
jgi:hypothetical protein